MTPHAEADNAPLSKYAAVGSVAHERSTASFAPRMGLIAAAAMNPADAKLCAMNSVVVIFVAMRLKSVIVPVSAAVPGGAFNAADGVESN